MAKQIDLEDGGTVTCAWGRDGWFWEIHDNQGRKVSLFRMSENDRARFAGLLISSMTIPFVMVDDDLLISSVRVISVKR